MGTGDIPASTRSVESASVTRETLPFRVATWNMDHWRRSPDERAAAWHRLTRHVAPDVALVQEAVPPVGMRRGAVVYREIGRSRSWGSAVVACNDAVELDEIWAVRTRYSHQTFPVAAAYPGAVAIAQAQIMSVEPITFVSVYGLIDVYSQTTLFRIIADLIPLFDSPEGERVILGGDLNAGTDAKPGPEIKRYEAILHSLESLGLANLYERAVVRPDAPEDCLCRRPDCRHLTTREGGGQFDYLFATPGLVKDLVRIERFDDPETKGLSDHWPIVAEFRFAAKATPADSDRFDAPADDRVAVVSGAGL